MCSVACALSSPLEGSSGALGPWRGFGTGDRESSVELPLDDVRRHVEEVRGQNDRYAEGVAVPKEGQKVIGAGLGHHR